MRQVRCSVLTNKADVIQKTYVMRVLCVRDIRTCECGRNFKGEATST